MHVEADLLNYVRDVRTREGQVLEGTGEAAMLCRISDGRASGSSKFRCRVDGC